MKLELITLVANCVTLVIAVGLFIVNWKRHFQIKWINNTLKQIGFISALSAAIQMLLDEDIIIELMGSFLVGCLGWLVYAHIKEYIELAPARKKLQEQLPQAAISSMVASGRHTPQSARASVLNICQQIVKDPETEAFLEMMLSDLAVRNSPKLMQCKYLSPHPNYLRCTPNPNATTCEGCQYFEPLNF